MLDENNQAPYFQVATYHGFISEAAPLGTTISSSANLSTPLTIIALDNDIEEVRSLSFCACAQTAITFTCPEGPDVCMCVYRNVPMKLTKATGLWSI